MIYKLFKLFFFAVMIAAFLFNVFLGWSLYARAQQTPPQSTYVPLTLDESEYVSLRNYLNQQPYMFAAPVINLLDQAEQRAVKIRARPQDPAPASTTPIEQAPK